MDPELQIFRRADRDNFGILIIHISPKNLFCDPSLELSYQDGSKLIRGHNICFHGEIRKITPEKFSNPHLIFF